MNHSCLLPATADRLPAIQAMLAEHLAELGAPQHYPYLTLYWQEADRFPFIIGQAAAEGFALVRTLPGSQAHELAEFYICPESRRKGLGTRAVGELLSCFPGAWQLRVGDANTAGLRFWRVVLPPPLLEEASPDSGQRLLSFSASSSRG